MSNYVTLAEAEALFDELRDAFASLSKIVERIIETRAWETLGYASFAAAWRAQFTGVPLRTDVEKLLVISAMAETESAADIAAALPGVGPGTVERVFERLEMGLRPEQISLAKCAEDQYIRVAHPVRYPSPARRVHVDLGEERYRSLKAACAAAGVTPGQFINEAIAARLELLTRGELAPA